MLPSLPPVPAQRCESVADNVSLSKVRVVNGRSRIGLSSAFAPVSSDAGERFSMRSHQRDKTEQPGPGRYQPDPGIGKAQQDSTFISHRASGFAGGQSAQQSPRPRNDAVRNSVGRLFRKMQAHKNAPATLADIWDQCGRNVMRTTGELVRRSEVWRGLASLGLQLVDADLDVLFAMCNVTKPDGGIDLRELADAIQRSGLVAEVSHTQTEQHVDRMFERSFAHVTPRGKVPAPPEGGRTRTGRSPRPRRGHALGSWQIAREDDGKPVQQQLRNALTRQAVRVIDLFREWDTSMDGLLSLEEFVEGVRRLGFKADAPAVEALFRSWDADGSGEVSCTSTLTPYTPLHGLTRPYTASHAFTRPRTPSHAITRPHTASHAIKCHQTPTRTLTPTHPHPPALVQ